MHRVILGLALASLLLPVNTNAQEDALVAGRRSISVSLPDGGGSEFGFWKMKDERVNRGFFIHLGASHGSQEADTGFESSSTSISIGVGPRWRKYVTERSVPVVPFGQFDVRLDGRYVRGDHVFADGAIIDQDSWRAGVGANLAAGAEWFPARRVSISAHTGVGVSWAYDKSDSNSANSWALGTFASALSLQLYF